MRNIQSQQYRPQHYQCQNREFPKPPVQYQMITSHSFGGIYDNTTLNFLLPASDSNVKYCMEKSSFEKKKKSRQHFKISCIQGKG